jgi:hypothetical protein
LISFRQGLTINFDKSLTDQQGQERRIEIKARQADNWAILCFLERGGW